MWRKFKKAGAMVLVGAMIAEGAIPYNVLTAEAAETAVANVLAEYNTNFEGAGWWSDSSWKDYAVTPYAEGEQPGEECGKSYLTVTDKEAHINAAGILEPNGTYKFSYYVKLGEGVKSAEPKLEVIAHPDWSTFNPAEVVYDKEVTVSDKWQKVTGTIKMPDCADSDEIMVKFSDANGAVFCIDALNLEFVREISADQNVISNFNTSFEGAGWWSDASWKDYAVTKYAKGEQPGADCGEAYVTAENQLHINHGDIASALKSGGTYAFTYYAKLADGVDKGDVKLEIASHDASWGNYMAAELEYDKDITLTNQWQKLSGTFDMPENDAAEEVKIEFTAPEGVKFCIDELKIAELSSGAVQSEDKKIAIKSLEQATMYNATVTEDGDALKVDLAAQWDEARFVIPEDIASRVEGFKINGDDSNFGSMSVKMLVKDDKYTDNSGEEFAVAYQTSQVKAKNTNLVPIKYVGIMNHSEGPITFKIDSITFFLNDGTVVDRSIQQDIPDLRDVLTKNGIERTGVALPASALTDSDRMDLVHKHFNSVTCENEMKPASILGGEPTIVEKTADNKLGLKLHFEDGDKILDDLIAYNKENGTDIKMRGHVLAWHSQTPAWFYHEDYDTSKPLLSKEAMLERLDNYIEAVMNHYYGKSSPYDGMIYAWDVVNEAVSDATNKVRTQGDAAGVETSWYSIFSGDDTFIREAFKSANKYAPSYVKLFYNDYNDTTPGKVKGICNLLTAIKSTEGARIDGMGMQGHYGMDSPSLAEFENAVRAYSAIVGEVQITELDFKASNGYTGAKDQVEGEYTKEGHRYKNLFNKINELDAEDGIDISAVVLWGTDDGHSWLNDANTVGGSGDGSPVCPLPFDANYQAKPAYWGIVQQDTLLPFVNEVDSLKGVNSSLNFDEANATIIPSWDENGITFKIQVKDEKEDATDAVTLYVDIDGTIEKYTVKRADAKKIDGGYEAEIKVKKSLKVLQKVAFDVVVQDGEKKISYNDTTNSQDSTSKYYAKMTLKPFMSIGKGSAKIDGKVDDIWKNVPETKLEVVSGSPEASATAKVMWDADNLYILMNVKDPTVDVSASAAHEQDSVEIFIDEDNKKTDSLDGNDKQYRINAENVQSFNGESCTADNIVSKTTKTKDGYMVETAIKWTSMKASAGSMIGLDLQINDGKGGTRIGTANWYDASGSGWSKSAVFGTAELSKELVPTSTASEEKVANPKFSAKSTKIQKGKTSSALATDITLGKGDSIKSWKSSKKSIVTVDKKGKIKAKKVGKATITVTTKKGKKATITVNVVKGKVTTTKLKLKNKATNKSIANKKVVSLKKGKTLQLKPVVTPITSASKLTFKSSKKSIATVTSKGKVTAKKAGKTTITVTSGKKSIKFTVKVK
ncbi:MAG: endo-1,4-beta-xylanase [Eubacteriales bacterium]|nr:endo-1,4-beta-xylanase [Eubacteriales bacterium]